MRSFRNRTARPPRALAWVALALMMGASGAAAQDQDVQLELRSRGGAPIKLAVPMLTAAPGAEEHARTLYDILWQDLDWSMAFEMVDPAVYPSAGTGSGTGATIRWDAWRATGARALITGVVNVQGDRLYAEFRLFDVATGTQVTGKRYTQPLGSGAPGEAEYRVRRVAHLFNDETVLYYTGIRGVAGSQIAFVSDREAPVGTPQKEIFISDYDGQRQRRITYDASIALSPSFSPQADRIAFQTYRVYNGAPNAEIFMILKSGGQPRPLVTCKGTNSGANFSPDGALLAYASTCSGNSEIHTIRPDGTDAQRLTRNPGSDVSPAWSPNGGQIVFVSDRSGSQQIYLMDATGLNTRRLSAPGGQKDDPAWQPIRGELIAYTASTGGNNFDIFVYDLTTDRAYQLTRGAGRKEAPTWSPDGRQLAFEWARGSSIQIWVMGLDGSRQRTLTNMGNNVTPSWGNRP